MRTQLVKAYFGKGDKKVFAGEIETELADTLDEAKGLYGEPQAVKHLNKSVVIDVQQSLRNGGSDDDNVLRAKLDSILAKARANPDSSIAQYLGEKGYNI